MSCDVVYSIFWTDLHSVEQELSSNAEMGDRLDNRHGPKGGGAAVPLSVGKLGS